MVCTGDDEPEEPDEPDVVVETDEERRRDVRTLLGEKRERIVWKRVVCMLKVCILNDYVNVVVSLRFRKSRNNSRPSTLSGVLLCEEKASDRQLSLLN